MNFVKCQSPPRPMGSRLHVYPVHQRPWRRDTEPPKPSNPQKTAKTHFCCCGVGRDRQADRQTDRQTHRQTEREREGDRDRQRQTETERDRQRQTERDRDRQRQTDTDRQKKTDRPADRTDFDPTQPINWPTTDRPDKHTDRLDRPNRQTGKTGGNNKNAFSLIFMRGLGGSVSCRHGRWRKRLTCNREPMGRWGLGGLIKFIIACGASGKKHIGTVRACVLRCIFFVCFLINGLLVFSLFFDIY